MTTDRTTPEREAVAPPSDNLFDAIDLASQVYEKMSRERITYREAAPLIPTSPATLNRVAHGKAPDVETYLRIVRWLSAEAEPKSLTTSSAGVPDAANLALRLAAAHDEISGSPTEAVTAIEAGVDMCRSYWEHIARAVTLSTAPKSEGGAGDDAPTSEAFSVETIGQPCTLAACPPGPFLFEGRTLGFKTDYGKWPEPFILDTGESFWGGTHDIEARATLIVQPLFIAALTAEQLGVEGGARSRALLRSKEPL